MALAPAKIADRPAVTLSIDGGGIRGLIPAIILSALRAEIGRELHESFDLISGTSTGGIIAVAVGSDSAGGRPYTPDALVQLYVENGPKIFKPQLFSGVTQFWRPKYGAGSIEDVLRAFFGDTQLRAARTPLLITSYDLKSQLPFFFKSHRIPDDPTYDWPLWQVARATSAAPTFFPPFRLQQGESQEYVLVDGGILVNDPAMAAYAESRNLYPQAKGHVVVSVGTGDRNDRITYEECRNWGKLQWATRITSVMMDSVEEATDYELRAMAGDQLKYFRLQVSPLTGASPEMDDVSPQNLQALQQVARKFVDDNIGKLQGIAAAIRQAHGWKASGAMG